MIEVFSQFVSLINDTIKINPDIYNILIAFSVLLIVIIFIRVVNN